MTLPTVWIVGDWSEPVFAEAVAWLREFADCCCFDSPQMVIERQPLAADEGDPAAIVFALSRPGLFTATEVERLHASRPLSRLVALTGPWCEGEQRSGRSWAGVVRVAWRGWRSRLPSELGLGEAANSRLPRTVSDVERVENVTVAVRGTPGRGTAVIRTRYLVNYRYLADAVGQVGWGAVPFALSEACADEKYDVVVCDGWENVPGDKEMTPRRVLVLHFPRPEDWARARGVGIREVVAQPLMLSELADALRK